MATVEEKCIVEVAPETAFEFFRRPELVLGISDPSIGAKLIESPDVLSDGDHLTVELMAYGVVRRVVYRASIDPGSLTMIETMVEGDLKAWAHQKSFGGDATACEVVDQIEFEPPGGMAGMLLTADKIADHVSDGIAYRNQRLAQALAEFAS